MVIYIATVQLDLNLKHASTSHTCYFVTPVEYFKILHVCRHLHKNFACNACTLISVITTSSSTLHHTSILLQWPHICLLCICKRFKANNYTITLLPYYNNLCDNQIKASGDILMLATLKY